MYLLVFRMTALPSKEADQADHDELERDDMNSEVAG